MLYATTWQVLRTPWDITSTGPGGGLYKSTDGGDTWNKLTAGLPASNLGKIGVTVSPVNPQRVWATVEADEKGGVYRSDDGGRTWQLLNDSFNMTSRQYYYGHIFADPQEREHRLHVLREVLLQVHRRRHDLREVQTPHGDYHDLWIDPKNHLRMVNGSDGGAAITFNGGRSWTSLDNQPTAQFYAVTTDNSVPYRDLRVAAGQHDGLDREPDRRRRYHRRPTGTRSAAARAAISRRRVEPAGRLRWQLLRPDDALRRAHRPDAQRDDLARLQRRPHGRRRQVPLSVDLPDHRVAARRQHDVRRRAGACSARPTAARAGRRSAPT